MKKNKDSESIRLYLESHYKKICNHAFIDHDPVKFLHRYTKREDIEIAAFLTATIAWGRRDLILRSAEKMFALMKNSKTGSSELNGLHEFVMAGNFIKFKKGNIHRTFFEDDLKYFCRGFNHCYSKYGNMENLFLSAFNTSDAASDFIWNGIALFRKEMAAANNGKYSKHISNPESSACKRLNLALRWLVRKGPVDLELWKKIKPSVLYIPLDVHVARTARKIGLLKRKSNDKKAVIELTENLREFCKEDPVKYDFALFGIGIQNQTADRH